MTGFDSKRQMAQAKVQEEMQAFYTKRQAAQAKLDDDDDTQVYADGKAAAQRTWVGLTEEDWEHIDSKKGTTLNTFSQGAAWAEAKLKERNT